MSTKKDIPTILNQKEVTEDLIKAAAVLMGKRSNFYKALAIAKEYRDAGLTPMYIMDEDEKNIYVTTVERMAHEYH